MKFIQQNAGVPPLANDNGKLTHASSRANRQALMPRRNC